MVGRKVPFFVVLLNAGGFRAVKFAGAARRGGPGGASWEVVSITLLRCLLWMAMPPAKTTQNNPKAKRFWVFFSPALEEGYLRPALPVLGNPRVRKRWVFWEREERSSFLTWQELQLGMLLQRSFAFCGSVLTSTSGQ